MSELRYLSTDGDYLLLEAADGTQYRLLIDESVRKAARREVVSEGDAAKIAGYMGSGQTFDDAIGELLTIRRAFPIRRTVRWT